jgi:endonuclease YncB( thermonuclease family)
MSWRSIGYEWAGVVLLLTVLLAIHYVHPEWTDIVMGPSAELGNIYHAIDGDSFKVGPTEIRLYGIDAPEYRQSCTGASQLQQPCGKLARDALSELLRGRNIHCNTFDQDRYGREVSVCKDGTLDINREMVRLGWAVAYRKHAIAYVSVEAEAKKAKRGIWAWSFEMPEDYRARYRSSQGSVLGMED